MSHEIKPSTSRRVARFAGGAIVLIVAVGALAFGLAREFSRSERAAAPQPAAAPAQPDAVTVYYFHGDTRCPTCRAIETKATATVHEEFADELADGRLRFEVINYDTPENSHFREDFDLSFGSVVVQGPGEDRPWENLADVWTLVNADPLDFQAYLVEHIDRMLSAPE